MIYMLNRVGNLIIHLRDRCVNSYSSHAMDHFFHM